jgi:phosphomevalonate kinase
MSSEILQLKLVKLTDPNFAYNNMVYMNPADMAKLGIIAKQPVLINESVVHVLNSDENLDLPEGQLASSALLWKALHLDYKSAVGTVIKVEKWRDSKLNTNIKANTIVIVVDTYAKQITEISAKELPALASSSTSWVLDCAHRFEI